MLRRRRSRVLPGQEELLLEGPPSIEFMYSEERAQKAASRRRKRKGYLELTERTKGFTSKTKGLWVPGSEGELKYAQKGPETAMELAKNAARLRYHDRNRDNQDLSESQKGIRASFAAGNARVSVMGKITDFIIKANTAVCYCRDATNRDFGKPAQYTADTVRNSELAMLGVTNYFINLRSFTGANVEEHKKRKWIQDRHIHKMDEAREWASEYIQGLTDRETEGVFEEVIYSEWSRLNYWQIAGKRIEEATINHLSQPPDYIEVPLSVYDQCSVEPELL